MQWMEIPMNEIPLNSNDLIPVFQCIVPPPTFRVLDRNYIDKKEIA